MRAIIYSPERKYLLSICIVAVLGPGALGAKQIESLLSQSLRSTGRCGEGIITIVVRQQMCCDGRGKGEAMGTLELGVWGKEKL